MGLNSKAQPILNIMKPVDRGWQVPPDWEPKISDEQVDCSARVRLEDGRLGIVGSVSGYIAHVLLDDGTEEDAHFKTLAAEK